MGKARRLPLGLFADARSASTFRAGCMGRVVMTSGDRRGPPQVVDDLHELLKWMIPLLDRLPRKRRFTVGERIESGLLEVMELCIDAAYRRDPLAPLQQANRKLAVVRHLWRLLYELREIGMQRYGHGAERLVNAGRQIGAWRRSRERSA